MTSLSFNYLPGCRLLTFNIKTHLRVVFFTCKITRRFSRTANFIGARKKFSSKWRCACCIISVHVYVVRRGCYRRGKSRPWAESARRRVECRPKSVLMPKVLTSLSDRGRCNRNNNSNNNNHATAPRRYELIALLAIKASLVCACVFPWRSRRKKRKRRPLII